jgi:hypothetical protein
MEFGSKVKEKHKKAILIASEFPALHLYDFVDMHTYKIPFMCEVRMNLIALPSIYG